MSRSANQVGIRPLVGIACSLAVTLLALVPLAAPASAATVTDRSLLFDFDGSDSTAGSFVKPYKIAVDNSSGAVYVSEGALFFNAELNNAVSKFDADGNALDFSVTGTSSLFGTPSGPFGHSVGIAVDNSGGATQGRLYVADADNSRLVAFAPSGDLLWELDLGFRPQDVAVDSAGHPWLRNVDVDEVREYANTGSPPTQIDSFGVIRGESLDIDSSGAVYVADFSGEGTRKYVGGAFSSILDPAEAADVYADQSSPTGHVFISHWPTGTFDEYDAGGGLVGSYAGGALSAASGIAYNPSLDRVYVANQGLDIVEAFGPQTSGTVPDPTIEATAVAGPGTATFHGAINPQGVANAYYFEWAPARAIDSFASGEDGIFRSPLQSLPADSSPHPVEYKATNLQGGQDWDVRLVAVNTDMGLRALSGVDTFIQPKAAAGPVVTIAAPSEIEPESALITGTINPKEDSVSWQVEYTTDQTCVSGWTPGTTEYLPGGEVNTPKPVEYKLEGLKPSTHYCVRIRAKNSFELAQGTTSAPEQFETPALPPNEVSIAFAAPRTDTTARINGRFNPRGSADVTYRLEWSEDGVNWTALPLRESTLDSSTPILVSEELTGLKPNTTYHYRFGLVENITGPAESLGAERTFKTRTSAEMVLPQRGIEMVNNPDTGNQSVYLLQERRIPFMSSDGNRVLWGLSGGAPGSFTGIFAQFLAERTASGWKSRNVIPPASEQLGEGRLRYDLNAANLKLTRFTARVREPGSKVSEETLVGLDDQQHQHVFTTHNVDENKSKTLGKIDMSDDGTHVLAVDPDSKQLLDVSEDPPELLSVMPGGGSSECGLDSSLGYASIDSPQWRIGNHFTATTDASITYFATSPNGQCGEVRGLYVRDRETEETTLIAPGANGKSVEFIRASADGRTAFFLTRASLAPADQNGGFDLYRWDHDAGVSTCLTCVVPNADITPHSGLPMVTAMIVSDDFSHAYFQSAKRLIPGLGIVGKPNIYVVSGDELGYVATLDGNSQLIKQNAKLSADGEALVFRANPGNNTITADRVDCGGPCEQLYRYDDRDESVECLTCLAQGVTTHGIVADAYSGGFDISADGSTIAFATAEDLVAHDVNHTIDLYEWGEGAKRLITDGITELKGGTLASSPGVWGISDDGSSILFAVAQPGLTGFEQNGLRNFYVARIGGGFEPPAPPIHCSGDSCQGPIEAAPSPGHTASSAFAGHGNLKEAPAKRRPCTRKRGRARQRCVRKQRRSAQRKARANHDAGGTK